MHTELFASRLSSLLSCKRNAPDRPILSVALFTLLANERLPTLLTRHERVLAFASLSLCVGTRARSPLGPMRAPPTVGHDARLPRPIAIPLSYLSFSNASYYPPTLPLSLLLLLLLPPVPLPPNRGTTQRARVSLLSTACALALFTTRPGCLFLRFA